MKSKKWLSVPVFLGTVLLNLNLLATPDMDLQINGHFRGTAQGYNPAPGWTLTADGGNARVLPARSPDKFMLELQAAPNRSQSAVSDLFQVFGNMIEIKADLSGSGYASLGFEAFDQSRTRIVAADRQRICLARL